MYHGESLKLTAKLEWVFYKTSQPITYVHANFRLKTCTDSISKFEIASVKNTYLISTQSLAILR